MKEPSDKQVVFACWISEVTGKPLPQENTAEAYFVYIRENIELYQKLKSKKTKKIKTNTYIFQNTKKHIYNSIMDDDQDASWAAAMDFGWM